VYPADLPPYARLYCHLLQPVFERLRGKITPRVEKTISRTQWLGPEALQDMQWRELAVLLAWAVDRVDFYRQWFADNRLTVEQVVAQRDLSLLPLVDKQTITAQPSRFLADPLPAGSYPKTTGGTLGQPLSFMLNPESDHWRQAVSRRGYAWAGVAPGRRQLHVWSSDLIPLPRAAQFKRAVHRMLLRQHYVSYYRMLSPQDTDRALRRIDRLRPDNLVIYPSAAEVLCTRARQTGWRPRRPLVSVLTGAETLFDHQREMIQEVFGCPVFETYGSREFMLMAAECPAHQGMHVSAENLMMEILADGRPAEPGELGEVVVTDLHNFAQPFIRYRVGDTSAWLDQGPCACGRSLPRITKVEGKVVDMIVTPDGRRLTGHFFPHLLKDFPAVERYQIEQDREDHIIIRLKLRHDLADEDSRLILDKFRQTLPGVEPEIEVVDEVKIAPTGKVRITIGLDNQHGMTGPDIAGPGDAGQGEA